MILEKEWRKLENHPLFSRIDREGIAHMISCFKGCRKEYSHLEMVSLPEKK